MNTFWSLWITIITIGLLIAVAALLIYCSKNNTGIEEGQDMGHEYDGIREINNPLPKWWTYLFWATLFFAIGYLIMYPGLGNYKGILNWQSAHQNVSSFQELRENIIDAKKNQIYVQYDQEVDTAEALYGARLKQLIYQEDGQYIPVETLAKNTDAIQIGQRLFLQNCAQCHSSDARGSLHFPNLTDDDWLYGGTPEIIKTTLLDGRNGLMTPWGDVLGSDESVQDVVSYVLSLSGRKITDLRQLERGKEKFIVYCASCHNADGRGNQQLGGPNLTDNIWLHGGSRKAVTETIVYGRQGQMPAWRSILGEDKVHLLTAYVWQLSQDQDDVKPSE